MQRSLAEIAFARNLLGAGVQRPATLEFFAMAGAWSAARAAGLPWPLAFLAFALAAWAWNASSRVGIVFGLGAIARGLGAGWPVVLLGVPLSLTAVGASALVFMRAGPSAQAEFGNGDADGEAASVGEEKNSDPAPETK